MQFYSISDKGMVREANEDFCFSEKIGQYSVLFLADGMGGHNAGETASKMAGEIVFDILKKKLGKKLLPGQIMLMLAEAFEKANEHILSLSKKDSSLSGMGTTADVLLYKENTAYIAHIGDGRIYKLSPGEELTLLTKDHSLVEFMIESGALTREQAASHPQKNIITRALGISEEVNADVFSLTAEKGTRFLLCSDGLSNLVNEETLTQELHSDTTLSKTAKKLVQLANEQGGNDNITVILAEV